MVSLADEWSEVAGESGTSKDLFRADLEGVTKRLARLEDLPLVGDDGANGLGGSVDEEDEALAADVDTGVCATKRGWLSKATIFLFFPVSGRAGIVCSSSSSSSSSSSARRFPLVGENGFEVEAMATSLVGTDLWKMLELDKAFSLLLRDGARGVDGGCAARSALAGLIFSCCFFAAGCTVDLDSSLQSLYLAS